MSVAIFHLTNTDDPPNRYAIAQGSTFDWLAVVLDESYLGWTPKGQIRENYAEMGGKVKAVFSFGDVQKGTIALPQAGAVTGVILRPQLSATQTQALDWLTSKMVARTSEREHVIPGRNVWLYDVEMTLGDRVERVLQGYVEVSPEVTR